jgi:diguanylate cyclase (GGDEF)-like protein/PAS domain S-box-containing protein
MSANASAVAWLSGVATLEEPAEESSVLIQTLREADAHLDELSLRGLDPLARDGDWDTSTTGNARPAHIVRVDTQGRSLGLTDAGRQVDCFNSLIDTNYGLGLGMSDSDFNAGSAAYGSPQVLRIAAGVRSVLTGKVPRFCCEYVCRSNVQERWYLVTVTPMNEDYPTGAVIVYLDITAQKESEVGSRRLGVPVDAAGQGILLIARNSMRFVHANDAACRLLGKTRDEILAASPTQMLGIGDAELQSSFDFLIETGADAEPIELPQPRPDGSTGWTEIRRRAQYTGDGWTIVTFLRDVTERKIAEDRIAYLGRVQAMHQRVSSLVAHERDRKGLLKKVCRIAVQDGGLRLAMTALLDQHTAKLIPVGLASKDRRLRNVVRTMLLAADGVPSAMMKQAIREKRPVLYDDTQQDSKVAPAHANYGVRALAVFPLVIAHRVIGILSLYANESHFFQEAEIELLGRTINEVAFALDHIQKQDRLDYLASYDTVTGLANRDLFGDRVARVLRQPLLEGGMHALLLIDLHGFRNVNDSFGRSVGDALLRQVAEWLTSYVDRTDLVSRVGVDHFAVLLPDVAQQSELIALLETLVTTFATHPFVLSGAEYRIAARIGVSVYPEAGADPDTLLKHAEAALKKAKSSGDRYLFYTKKMTEAVVGRLTLENRLHQALDKDQFVLFYQPKIHLASGRLTGVEALLRWNDPDSGMVMPERFISILEEKGMIREVGRWVMHKAIADHLRWRRSGLNPVRIAINVSPLQLRNPGFVREVVQALAADAQAAVGLELEMTESLIMEDIKHNIECLEEIRAMGVRLAIDDFGTGFSSLSYLAKLPVHTLKIDRSFISDMTAGPEAIALVSTIVKLGHSMNLNVVAEGVETEQQSRLLSLLKCDEIQGYLSSMPMSSKMFEARYLLAPQTV